MLLFLGLDCGGSTCRALAADANGTTTFQGQSGPANLASTPERFIKANLAKATAGCPEPNVVCGCFAGLLTPEDAERARSFLAEIFPNSRLRLFPDFAAAQAAAERADFTVIAGTGSVVCSRVGGDFVKSGGRGYLFGDEGSGYSYGRRAFLQFLNSERPSQNLVASIEDLTSTTDRDAAVASIYRSSSPSTRLARLAKAFAKDLEQAQPYAASFLEVESEKLARVVVNHIKAHLSRRAAMTGSLAGGLWKLSPRFQSAIETAVLTAIPETQVSFAPLKKPPVYGALQLAMESLHEH